MVFTVGNGIVKFLLNVEDNKFVSVKSDLKIPEQTQGTLLIVQTPDIGPPVSSTYRELRDGAIGPEKNYNTRWVASLVETHRILERGVFIQAMIGRLRRRAIKEIYECGPIAYLLNKHLGCNKWNRANSWINRRKFTSKNPLVFGSKEEVETIKKFCEDLKCMHLFLNSRTV